jgi:hypothetical protein
VKVLYFSAGGFILHHKRLERGRFSMPHVPAAASQVVLDAASLAMLLDGVDLRAIKRAPRWEPARARKRAYKRHIAADLDTELILACAITPANRPEEEAAPELQADIARLPSRSEIGSLHIDRGYIGSSLVQDVLVRRGDVFCKPWVARNRGLFTKADFVINMRNRTIECPAGEIEHFQPGSVVEFDPDACGRCPQRARCTMASPDSGRTISIAEDEQLQHRLRKLIAAPKGRHALRERVAVEHRLAHLARKQGRRARYLGIRKNLFDVRRAAAIVNLETTNRQMSLAA